MTVPVPGSLTYSYDEDGITTVFAYPVRFFEPQELEVVREVGGVRTTLTYNVDYTVSGAGSPSGGSITRAAATDGGKIIITRNTAWKQIVDLTNNGRNPAESVEQQLDRLTMAGQDARAKLGVLLDKTSDIDEAVLRAESARDASEAAKESAEDSAAAALVSEQSAHDDAIATAADRVQTGLDAIATAADRVQTGLDRAATGADRTQTGLDAIATAADRVQTGLDASASGSSASAAIAAKDDAEAAKIAAEAAAASLNLPTIGAGDAGKSLVVKQDETGYEFGGGATAEDVTYDGTSSGLSATDVQGAIDELASSSGGDVAGDTHAAASKTTPVDADELPLVDSDASWSLKKLTWANLKAALASTFMTISGASQTITGHKRFSSSLTGINQVTGAGTMLEAFAGGTQAAAIAFHRSGVHAAYFGLDTDNRLKFGGWSLGANAYEVWHHGRVNAAGWSVPTAPTENGHVATKQYVDTLKWTELAPVATTSGTAIDWTSIPTSATDIELWFNGVSVSSTDHLLLQIGTGGAPTTSGYNSGSGLAGSNVRIASTAGMVIYSNSASYTHTGVLRLHKTTGNTWVCDHALFVDPATGTSAVGGGAVSLAGAINNIRLRSPGGSQTFDAGSIQVRYR